MARPHTSALIAHLEADSKLGLVADGRVKGKAPTKYVAVFADTPRYDVDRMAGRQRPLRVRYRIHCIGQTPEEAEWLADRVRDRLVGARLDVEGWDDRPIRHEGGDPLRLDSSIPPAVYFYADDYGWESTPAQKGAF